MKCRQVNFPVILHKTDVCKCFTTILAISINLSFFFKNGTHVYPDILDCYVHFFTPCTRSSAWWDNEKSSVLSSYKFSLELKNSLEEKFGWPLYTSNQLYLLNHEGSDCLIARWLFAAFASVLFLSLLAYQCLHLPWFLAREKCQGWSFPQPHVRDLVGWRTYR